ncbi:hypothetical protein GGI42DRAFT_361896 [Trichoderma sp. SZMC 28013]
MPTVSLDHLPADELYDLTPKKAAAPTHTDAKGFGGHGKIDDAPRWQEAVDFSETASTIHRRSSFEGANEHKDIWNFDDSPSDSSPIPETSKEIPTISSDHLPPDELYDFTPKKATAPTHRYQRI